MGNVLNRETLVVLYSVNTPDYDPIYWVINPDLTILETVPMHYLKLIGDTLTEMTPEEKAVVDAAQLLAEKNRVIPLICQKRENKIDTGQVEYPQGSGKYLSISDEDQSRWLGWNAIGGKWNALGMSFPFRVHSRDGSTYVDITKAQDFTAVVEAIWVQITTMFTEAETVIQNVRAATTLQGVADASSAYLASYSRKEVVE